MSQERAALIAAIRRTPDDDGLRLVCADWFEDQGDEADVARAEFIRVQVRRAELPPSDIRQSELQARELRLLRRWAPVWCGSHFVFKKVRFRRGFIEYVHLHLQHFLHHRRQMLALEPVRDVSLTGWYRAPDHLVRRVAGCAEWEEIETLRIHHQGPHHSPRSNIVLLLESPHLTRLRALHGTLVEFDADARRRFERLPILRRLTELSFPTLYWHPHNPGAWFGDGGRSIPNEWEQLRSLTLPNFLPLNLLMQLTESAFWDRLTCLRLRLPHQSNECLELLRDRMPAALEELSLSVSVYPTPLESAESFFAALARVPLRRLGLSGIPLPASGLRNLLAAATRWNLAELTLSGCNLTVEHALVMAESPALSRLHTLELSGNAQFRQDAAQALFSTENLASVVRLCLSGNGLGVPAAVALANARGWERLRSLNLSGTDMRQKGMQALLPSPNLRQLVCLIFSELGDPDSLELKISPNVASSLIALPNLAYLDLSLNRCDPRSRDILTGSQGPAWVFLESENEYDIRTYRANHAPERSPPVDDVP
jgi:uncharacterized protein (TIGR02996 family)